MARLSGQRRRVISQASTWWAVRRAGIGCEVISGLHATAKPSQSAAGISTQHPPAALTRLQLRLLPAWQCTSTPPPEASPVSMKAEASAGAGGA